MMDEIEKYRDLLALLQQLEESKPSSIPEEGELLNSDTGDDEEVSQWASWVLAANGKLLEEARIRTCKSGLAAVSQYMAERENA